MSAFEDFVSNLLNQITPFLRVDTGTFVILILMAFVVITTFFLGIYVFLGQRYVGDRETFFKRQMKEMLKDGSLKSKDIQLIPIIRSKKSLISLAEDELLYFFLPTQYRFYKLSARGEMTSIDLIVENRETIKDFEAVGRGKLFFTSKTLLFENVRSRNIMPWPSIRELKVKYGYLFLTNIEGCHAFLLEAPGIVYDFIDSTFLKEAQG